MWSYLHLYILCAIDELTVSTYFSISLKAETQVINFFYITANTFRRQGVKTKFGKVWKIVENNKRTQNCPFLMKKILR